MTKAKLSKTAEKKPVEDKKSLERVEEMAAGAPENAQANCEHSKAETEAPPPPDAEQEPGASSAVEKREHQLRMKHQQKVSL